MVEQRWLRTANEANGGLSVPGTGGSTGVSYSPIIDEITESFFAAPLLSIDETVLRAFPIDPFDVARTRRRQIVSASQAEQLVGAGEPPPSSTKRSALEELIAAPTVRTHFEEDRRELSAPATYARPSDSDLAAPSAAAPAVIVPALAPLPIIEAAPSAPVAPAVVAPSSSGWLAGGLLALAGIFVGGALVCAALTRNEARIEPMPSATAALISK